MFDGRVNYRFCIILLVILFTLALTFSGCSKYRTFTNNDGIAHFSFEYPGDIKKSHIHRVDAFVNVHFRREIVKDGWFDKDLYIAAFKPPGFANTYISDAKTLLEQDIVCLDEAYEVSRVLERSPININEIQGELVVSIYDYHTPRMPLPDAPLKGTPQQPSLMMMIRSAYFNQGGLVWIIRMIYTEEVAEETTVDFEHIINTFKILD